MTLDPNGNIWLQCIPFQHSLNVTFSIFNPITERVSSIEEYIENCHQELIDSTYSVHQRDHTLYLAGINGEETTLQVVDDWSPIPKNRTGLLVEDHSEMRHFRRKIKKITDLSSSNLISEIRMKTAQRFLENGLVGSVSEAAMEIGFKSPSSFSRAFKKCYGEAPLKYLKRK